MRTYHSRDALKQLFKESIAEDLNAAKRAAGNKEQQRSLLLDRKAERVGTQQVWVDSHLNMLKEYCRHDLPKQYIPKSLRFVMCREQWHHDLWRIVKLTHWSMPPNEYVGRRKRILVFDGDFLVGLIGLASSIWGLTARDQWIGWDVIQKTERINYVVDAYVLGAIPPYNGKYRGSKLLAYLSASDEIRQIWQQEYGSAPAAVVTTTLFGHSAVLNRVKHNDTKLWQHLGYTRGLGTMHFSLRTMTLAKEFLGESAIVVPDRITSGPNWKLRLMRTAIETAGLRAKEYLDHGYRRGIYLMEYAQNTKEFLTGTDAQLRFKCRNMSDLIDSWERLHTTQTSIC